MMVDGNMFFIGGFGMGLGIGVGVVVVGVYF